MKKEITYSVIYRTGGTENFKWNRVLDLFDNNTAIEEKNKLEKMGYKSLVFKTSELMAIGLPETY